MDWCYSNDKKVIRNIKEKKEEEKKRKKKKEKIRKK